MTLFFKWAEQDFLSCFIRDAGPGALGFFRCAIFFLPPRLASSPALSTRSVAPVLVRARRALTSQHSVSLFFVLFVPRLARLCEAAGGNRPFWARWVAPPPRLGQVSSVTSQVVSDGLIFFRLCLTGTSDFGCVAASACAPDAWRTAKPIAVIMYLPSTVSVFVFFCHRE